MALTMLSRVRFIQSDLRALGRCLNWLIISMGRANNPTPPNSTTKIHPKNDMIAMTQTANEAQSVRILVFSVVLMLLKSMVAGAGLASLQIRLVSMLLMGSSTYLKKFQLINSTIMAMMSARKVQNMDWPMRLQKPWSSSVQQQKLAKGSRMQMNSNTIRQTKYQKLFMSIPCKSKAELLATSSGTSSAWA